MSTPNFRSSGTNSKSFLQKIDEYSVGITIQDMSDKKLRHWGILILFFLKIVGMRVLVLFQEMYPDRLLVSPAPAGGNTNWFDPFFQVLL